MKDACMFETMDGRPVPAVDAATMREIDRIAIDETGPTLLQMMENAGRNLAAVVKKRLPRDGRVVVLAGSGGNGAGGICAARHLVNHQVDVTVVVTRPERMSEAAVWQLHVYGAAHGDLCAAADVAGLAPAVVIDALVGYSLSGAPSGVVADLIAWVNNSSATVVSLDVPSGLDASDGSSPGAMVAPDVVVTLALPKSGLAAFAGELLLADIAIPEDAFVRAGVSDARPFSGRYVIPLQRRSQ